MLKGRMWHASRGKVGSSVSGELARSEDHVTVSAFLEGVDAMNKLRNVVKNFESNPTKIKHYDLVSQEHRHLPINTFKRNINCTRISAGYDLVKIFLRWKNP